MITRSIVIGLLLFVCQQKGMSQGFLKAKGKLIVNEKGEKVILRGMGLGGWMLQEGYMLKLEPVGPQYRCRERITYGGAHNRAASFYVSGLPRKPRKINIDWMTTGRLTAPRLPMHYHL